MPRKATALPAEVERARLLALLHIYDAIAQAGSRARLYYVGDVYDKDEPPTLLLAELRNQAVTLTTLAPPLDFPSDAGERLTNMFLSMFPGLEISTPAQGDSV